MTDTYLFVDRTKSPIAKYVLETYDDGKKTSSVKYEDEKAIAKWLFQNPRNVVADRLPPGRLSIDMNEAGEVTGYFDVIDSGKLDDIRKHLDDFKSNPPKNGSGLEHKVQ